MKNIRVLLSVFSVMLLVACTGVNSGGGNNNDFWQPTPSVDFVEQLDVWSAPHQDSFLNMLAMNYRSFAIWNAREIGNFEIGELFANKAVAAFSGDTPMPEIVDNWNIFGEDDVFEMNRGLDALVRALRSHDAADMCPEISAEAQAKFDCWVAATASGQNATANECRRRFGVAMNVLQNPAGCDQKIMRPNAPAAEPEMPERDKREVVFYPDTGGLSTVAKSSRTREGVIIVNTVHVPENLITPVPVPQAPPAPPTHQIIFNQNIFGGDGRPPVNCVNDEECEDEFEPAWPVEDSRQDSNELNEMMQEILDNQRAAAEQPRQRAARPSDNPQLGEQTVSRDEFINMMMLLRQELAAINKRLDDMGGDKAVIKVQQIPLEPQQHVMEEIFEIRFDFDKYHIKPEYDQVIRNLVQTAGQHKNVKISVVGHTDTVGSANYNFALGGRRAEAVRQTLIKRGIPASQIVAVSSGMNNLKVPTGPGVRKAENRRVRVVRETHWTEPGGVITPEVIVQQGTPETLYGEIPE